MPRNVPDRDQNADKGVTKSDGQTDDVDKTGANLDVETNDNSCDGNETEVGVAAGDDINIDVNGLADARTKTRVSPEQLVILTSEWRDFGDQFTRNNATAPATLTLGSASKSSSPNQYCETTAIASGQLALVFDPTCFELEWRISRSKPIRGRPHIWRAKRLATYRARRRRDHDKIEAYVNEHRAELNLKRKLWTKANPEKAKAAKKRERDTDYHRPFIAVDSEGRDFDGRDINYNGAKWKEHRSILWAMGRAVRVGNTEFRDTDVHFLDNKGASLKTREIMDWLILASQEIHKKYGDVNFISYAFGYDVTQILAGLPREKVWEIARGKTFPKNGRKSRRVRMPTLYGPFAISYRKGKRLTIARLNDPDHPYAVNAKGKKVLDVLHSITIYDAFGFYQKSFLKVVESLVNQGLATNKELGLIELGKKRRPEHDNTPLEDIKTYTAKELSLMSRALTTLRDDGFDQMGLRPREWSGAGAAAAALLRVMNFKRHNPTGDDAIRTRDISKSQLTAHHAFVGGRIELLEQGYAPDREFFGYDIVSAYPSVWVDLPSMNGGEFHEVKNPALWRVPSANIFSRYLVRWQFPLWRKRTKAKPDLNFYPFYPIPYRRKDHAILFPAEGYAWVMRDDLVAAIKWIKAFRLKPRDYVLIVEEALEFFPANDLRPYADYVKRYSEMRRLIDASPIKLVSGQAIKLTLSSLYGKSAQRIGGSGFEPPGCANPHVAAATTAATRRRLIEAALIDPFAVVMFATDGVISKRELNGLERVKRADNKDDPKLLGDWVMKRLHGGIFLQAGVYSYLDDDCKETTKMRGTDIRNVKTATSMRDFMINEVLPAWERPFDYEDKDTWPTVTTLQRSYMTASSAVATPVRFRVIGRWADTTRQIRVHSIGVKRIHHPDHREYYWSEKLPDGTVRKADRCSRLIPTAPTPNDTPDVLSRPLYPEWLDLSTEADWLSEGPENSGGEDDDDGFDEMNEQEAILTEHGG